MLDIQTLVEADDSYRDALIAKLSGMDQNWSFINAEDKAGGSPDQKGTRVGLQIKLALLSLVQDYGRLREIAEGLVELARPSPELSKFVGDQLEMLSVSSRRTALRVIAGSTLESLRAGDSFPRAVDEGRKSNPPVFIVAEDDMMVQFSTRGLIWPGGAFSASRHQRERQSATWPSPTGLSKAALPNGGPSAMT